jgi:hypothetical protein
MAAAENNSYARQTDRGRIDPVSESVLEISVPLPKNLPRDRKE